MRRDPQKFKLGVFVLIGLTLAVAGVLAFGAGQLFRKTKTVYCYFSESVQGLVTGSPLSYRGVEVGKVTEIQLLSQDRESGSHAGALIQVRCEVYPDVIGIEPSMVVFQKEMNEYIRQLVARGLRVTIKWKDITGQKYLSLDHYHPIENHPIPDLGSTHGVTARQPYIPTAREATLEDIQRDLASTLAALSRVRYEEISDRIVDLLEITTQRVEALDTQALQGHAEETLVAVRRMAEDPVLRRVIDRMDTITANLESATAHVDGIVGKPEVVATIDDFAETAAALRRTTAQLEKDIPRLVGALDGVISKADSAVGASDVPRTTEAIREAADEIGGAARNVGAMRQDLQRVLREVSAASRAIGRLAKALEEDPGAILRGRGGGEE